MIVREDRESLRNCIQEYLDDKITAFELDDRLYAYGESQDETVRAIAWEMWGFYDDIKDHKVVASKKEWDYWQRLLLVLESDSELDWRQRWVWHFSQPVALCGLMLIGYSFWMDWGVGVLCWFVFWPISILLWKTREERRKELQENIRMECYPFSDLREIRLAVGRTRRFRKQKYPALLRSRRIRDHVSDFLMGIQSYLVLSTLTPLMLFAQCFPIRHERWKVQIPEYCTRSWDDESST